MNEVAGALVGTGVTLGLVPCGSGDGLGRHLRIHGSLSHVFDVIRRGHSRWIDTGLADGHCFFSVAGLAFEAEISRQFNQLVRRGFWGYLKTASKAVRTWNPPEFRITYDTRTETLRAFTVAVANSGQYGNNARIACDAQIDDGLLDLVAIPPVTWRNGLPLVAALFTGRLAASPGVVCRRAQRFTIQQEAPGWLQTDGEIHSVGPTVDFTIRPLSLRVLCPESAVTPGADALPPPLPSERSR